ncbi:hypothetical protein GCM10009676_13290 [Prauserella halophila]|uniref:Zinc-finger domain-containing protein n=1 Tax=Prauserella halophila TaxID=185641 RepID=A0ABN1W3V5_9PSEU|nr:hypothetical protein [Prauserella halophila]MCP2236454.1 hypothetical protein [Prauserella halophila]
MTHWDDERLLDALRRTDATADALPADEHLRNCADCRQRFAAMRKLSDAGRVVAAESAADLRVPSFESVRAALPTASPVAADPVPRRTPRETLRLVSALVAAQVRLLPGALGPVSALGFAAAVGLALALPGNGLAEHVFSALVVLVVLTGVLTTSSQNRDPRTEALVALPISPPTVFTCRVVGVLGIDLAIATACSALVRLFGAADDLPSLLASWFGQALLTAGIALVFAVGRSPVLGVLTGGLAWLLGATSSVPAASGLPLHSAVSTLWSTSPLVLALGVALLAVAVLRLRVPRPMH